MKKFLLFLAGLVAFMVLLANIGPMVFFALGIWLLYVIFKQFMKTDSVAGKVGWVIVGLIVLSMTISNMFALIGVVAIAALYMVYKSWKKEDDVPVVHHIKEDDPFTNFEREWAELNK
ncbi:flagellar basal body rod protein [Virgibacillus chiguensis]|uniref:Lia operon protein LiaI n=1 Tax=Virgibacillus chiguensis TaxID=411959 RepID=A0A1M5S7H0_9BACI|nr:flagellar basal body rod protein [Virgibacillus chiguensis]SHH34238.1 lia operon protein LiaI [Virgibacillus chiguensis]